jgi:NADH-quinone oxidoreductase subunit M
MSFINSHLLTIITVVPIVFTVIGMFIPKDKHLAIKVNALIGTALVLVIAVYLLFQFDYSNGGFQMVEHYRWIESIGAEYYMAIDGISLPIILVTALLTLICIVASWHYDHRPKEYFDLMLLLEVGMIGVFLALDFILFYIFWELVLIPMYFLIGIWGGPRKEYAAIKFFLYTLAGSVIMLLGILALYFYSGIGSFNMLKLAKANIPLGVEKIVFLSFLVGFGVKVPIVPLHTWLPDAHVEAPTAVSVLLAGVLLKMGTYAFVRIGLQVIYRGMKPFLYLVGIIGVVSIIYGAFNAMVQKDLKKLVAYSSVSHMGYVMLGIASVSPRGLSGAVLYMFNHGTITGMLFLLVGLIYERTHTRQIEELGGLFISIPLIAAIWAYISFASLGLPSLSGFVSEFLVLVGSFPIYPILTGVAAIGIVITAGYFIWTIQRICLGKPKAKRELPDATPREIFYMLPLIAIILIVGIYPAPLLKIINPSVHLLLSKIGGM